MYSQFMMHGQKNIKLHTIYTSKTLTKLAIYVYRNIEVHSSNHCCSGKAI